MPQVMDMASTYDLLMIYALLELSPGMKITKFMVRVSEIFCDD